MLIIQAAILSWSLSLDAFIASFAYGSKRIKIPMISIHIINLVGSTVLGLALFAGAFLRQHIPLEIAATLSFSILFTIGLLKLCSNHSQATTEIKTICPTEAALLALTLSLDGLAVGFGIALVNVNIWAVLAWSLISDIVLLVAGNRLGMKLAQKSRINLSWLAGLVFIGLAFFQLL